MTQQLYTIDYGLAVTGSGGDIAGANTVTANTFAGTQANVQLVADAKTWTFDTDGNLTFPGNLIIPSMAGIVGDSASPAPYISGFDSITTASGGNLGGFTFGASNLTLPGNTFSVYYANGTQVSIGGGSIGNLQATGNVIYATDGSNPTGYINFDNGTSTVLGTNGNTNVQIGTNTAGISKYWNFDTDGNLITPGSIMAVVNTGNIVLGRATATGSPGLSSTTSVTFAANRDGTVKEMVFTTGGNLTIPGYISATNIGNISSTNLDGNASNVLYGNGVFAAVGGGSYGDSNVVTLLSSYGSNTVSTTGNVTVGNVVFGANTGQVSFHTGAYISGNANSISRDGSIILQPYTGAGSTFPGVVIGGAGRLLSPGGSVHQVFNASDVTFQVVTKIITGTAATSTSTGALQLTSTGGIGAGGNIFVGGLISVAGNANVGNIGTAGVITATGNITGGNINTAGVVSATGNVTGGTLIASGASGDEGGEINLTKAPNSSLSGNIVIDQYIDKIRFFDGGGTSRGAYIDLAQAGAGVSTLLNNRVVSIVNSGVFVTMDLLKVQLTSSGNRGLSIASTTGSFTVNIGATYSTATSSIAGSAAVVVVTTTASAALFGWNFSGQADTSTYVFTDITNNRAYRVTLQIGASFNNNLISIERLL